MDKKEENKNTQLSLKYRIAIFLLDLISKTWRIKVEGQIPQKPSIIIFWHGVMLPVWKNFSGKEPYALVSLSKDGSILSALLEKWNFNLLRGSSSHQGKEVLNKMLKVANKSYLLITPDGPRGPIHKCKPGAAITGHRTQVPIVPCICKIKHKIIFQKSWDKFQLPLPFSKIQLIFTNEIFINKNCNRNEINDYINIMENRLNQI